MRAVLALLMVVAACRRDEEIVRVREPKEGAPAMAASSSPLGLRWTLPAGWKELPASGMRAATLLAPGAAGLETTIVALP